LEYEENSFEYLSDSKMPEPLKWLTSSDKVVLTPHVAGWTKESYYKLSSFLADKILARFP
jgi:D-3-phosphoglycerate dehydrogenase